MTRLLTGATNDSASAEITRPLFGFGLGDSKMMTSDSETDLRLGALLGVVLIFDLVLTISSDVDTPTLPCLSRFGKEKENRGLGLGDRAGLTLSVKFIEMRQ